MAEYEGLYAHFADLLSGRKLDGLRRLSTWWPTLPHRLAPRRGALPLVRGIEVHGYAIVSNDDRIADAAGAMPAALRNEADWAYFQAGLDRADWVAIGRASHEATPNVKGRRRIVLSRAARGLERRADGLWWNPRERRFADVMAELAPGGARVAVPGGQAAFDVFLEAASRPSTCPARPAWRCLGGAACSRSASKARAPRLRFRSRALPPARRSTSTLRPASR